MIKIKNLHKSFEDTKVLKGISMTRFGQSRHEGSFSDTS